jgi:hypothetical protein
VGRGSEFAVLLLEGLAFSAVDASTDHREIHAVRIGTCFGSFRKGGLPKKFAMRKWERVSDGLAVGPMK